MCELRSVLPKHRPPCMPLPCDLAHPASPRSNKWNQLVHFIFVPAIWWTVAGVSFLDLWHFMSRASSGGMLLASTWVEFVA